MKTSRKCFFTFSLGTGIALISLLVTPVVTRADDDHPRMRWDIISVDFASGTLSAGGIASAKANDNSRITLTGSGTFTPGDSEEVSGGGTWTISNEGSGRYRVTGLVRWEGAPGTPPLPHDNIGELADNRAGLVVLRVLYDDGSRGVLAVSCHLVETPDSVFEGITASKGFVDYWNREEPPAPPGNANRTTFHIVREDDDN